MTIPKISRHTSADQVDGVIHEGADWLNTNFFDEKAIAPSKRRRAPSPIPDTRLLFQVQDDVLKIMTAIKKLPVPTEDDDDYAKALKALENSADNTYRLINRYLRTYVNNEVQ